MVTVAIIGAGPSGCYVAQALIKARPDAEVTIFDALPVPYGLIRYGVAADHQGTKGVIRQFERLFERQGVRFAGNVTLGREVTLEALRAAHDAVVLATGLHGDRRLGVPGDDLPGVIGSGALTRVWNGYPDADVPAVGARVVVLGNGNVAVDVVRLLAKTPDECHGSDLGCDPGRGVREITVIGRSPAEAGKFDVAMLRELGRLGDCAITVADLPAPVEGESKLLEVLRGFDGHAPAGASKRLTFRFGKTPQEVTGEGAVSGIRFADGTEIAADTIVTAIGFEGEIAGAGEDGLIEPGLYAVGWVRRGPRGTIPENRADAQRVAARIAADLPQTSDRPGLSPPGASDYAGWKRIDAEECARAPEGRVRAKITTLSGLNRLAQQEETP